MLAERNTNGCEFMFSCQIMTVIIEIYGYFIVHAALANLFYVYVLQFISDRPFFNSNFSLLKYVKKLQNQIECSKFCMLYFKTFT
jgi:hypothetical protein